MKKWLPYENTEPIKPPNKTISHRLERPSDSKNNDLTAVTERKVKDRKPWGLELSRWIAVTNRSLPITESE
jgi:3-methyladenine DNA glycosylase AlkC